MEPEDVAKIEELKKSFDQVAAFVESDFQGRRWMAKFSNLYTTVYDIATKPKVNDVQDHYRVHAELYSVCGDILKGYIERYPVDLEARGDKLFFAVVRRWHHYKISMQWTEKTFRYLSRYYIPHCNVDTIETLGLQIFYTDIFHRIAPQLAHSILSLVTRERNGEMIESAQICTGTDLFVRMTSIQTTPSIYKDHLEQPIIARTTEHYKKLSAKWLETDSTTAYLEKAEAELNAEQRRCSKYFQVIATDIMRVAEKELLGENQEALLTKEHSGFVSLLRDLRTEHLRRMYTLFGKLPNGLEPMGRLLREQCILEAGEITKRYSGEADPNFQGYVSDFIALHEKYVKILNDQLENSPVFQKAIKDAFEVGLNQGLPAEGGVKIHCAELLSNYCDHLIRGTEKLRESELDEKFDSLVALLAHVQDKDLFQAHARKHLSKRLLSGVGAEETEKLLISKFKAKSGATFTSHFEGMINDKNVSLEAQQAFTTFYNTGRGQLPFDFAALVLTSGFWPKQPTDECVLPSDVARLYDAFQLYYHQKTAHRVLQWTNSNATATVLGRYKNPSVIREFQLTAFQACVLLSFNTRDSYTAGELSKELRLDWEELKRILPSFTKLKMIVRSGNSQALREEDVFRYNPEFTSQHRKLRVPLFQPKIVQQASAQVRMIVEEDRSHAIDACLVRIMKHHKVFEHTQLVAECIKILSARFQPDPKQIKLRIEDLIGRDFLERVPDSSPSSYRYLA